MLLLTLACYQPPLNRDTANYPDQVVLSGDLVLAQGTPSGGPGTGHVLLYSAANPPPPVGTGTPQNFATVPRSAWSYLSTADTDGAASASWSMTGVQDGTYLLTALVDNDGDFNPFPGISDYAGGATCGDQLGAYVSDAAAPGPLPITLTGPDSIQGLSLLIGAPLESERPAYTMAEAPVFDPTIAPDPSDLSGTLQTLVLNSTGIQSPLLTLNSPNATHCPTLFTMMLKDLDGDGVADPFDDPDIAALGGLDLWPLVLLSYRSDLEGNSLDDGSRVITQMLVSPFGIADETPVNTPFYVDTLPLMFLPLAKRIHADGSEELLSGDDFPRGIYSLVVINHTGQLWTTPNSLGELLPEQAATVVIQ